MENDKIESFYDSFKKRQKSIGVNKRHEYILKHLVNNGVKESSEILEIGCGIGTLTGLLAAFLKKGKIIANDLSKESIAEAKSRLKEFKNIEFFEGNILETGIDGKFEFIVLADVIEHIPLEHHSALFKTIKGALKENGKVLVNIPNPYYLEWCIKNIPEKLQIIDQPIHLGQLIKNLSVNDLQISQLITYSVWVEEGDYRFIVIEHDRELKTVRDL